MPWFPSVSGGGGRGGGGGDSLKSSARTSCRNISSANPTKIPNSAVVGITQHLIFLFMKTKPLPIIYIHFWSALARLSNSPRWRHSNVSISNKVGLAIHTFSPFPLCSPTSRLALPHAGWLPAWTGAFGHSTGPDVCGCCVHRTPQNSFWAKMGKCRRANGEVRDSLSPSCHKSCLAAQNKLLLETSLLALHLLPFITSEELQKLKRKKKQRNLSTGNTHISKSAFLFSGQGNICNQ